MAYAPQLYISGYSAPPVAGLYHVNIQGDATAAELGDGMDAINTIGKTAGKLVWDSTNNRVMRAAGSAVTSPWEAANGSGSITPSAGATLAAIVGTFALGGQAATLKRGLRLTAGAGAFALTGKAVAFLRGKTVTAASGSYVITGQAITPVRTYRLTAAAGALALTGKAAVLSKAGTKVIANLGTFALTGQAANLKRALKLTAARGTFTETGQAAILKRGLKITAAAGSFALTGVAATLTKTASSVAVVHTASLSALNSNPANYGTLSGFTGTFQHIALVVAGRGAGAARTISSVTVGGVAATVIPSTTLTDTRDTVAIYIIATTTTAPNVTVTWSGNMGETQVYAVALSGLNSVTALAATTNDTNGAASVNVNTNAGGIVIAGQRNRGTGAAAATVGLDTVVNIVVATGSEQLVAGYGLAASNETPRSVSITPAAADTTVTCSASFR